MNRSRKQLLLTGVPGTGKSTLVRYLNSIGETALDIESIPGLFNWYSNETGERLIDIDTSDKAQVLSATWRCEPQALRALIAKQAAVQRAFYSGNTSNLEELLPLFNVVLLLRVSPDELRRRLSRREGTPEFGGSKEMLEEIISYQKWVDEKLIENGAIPINADRPVEQIAKRILKDWA